MTCTDHKTYFAKNPYKHPTYITLNPGTDYDITGGKSDLVAWIREDEYESKGGDRYNDKRCIDQEDITVTAALGMYSTLVRASACF